MFIDNMKVLAYPKSSNPYQELLYKELRKFVTVDYFKPSTNSHTLQMIFMPFNLIFKRMSGYTIFHLHWTYPFKFPLFTNKVLKLVYSIYFIFILLFIKVLGYKLVWTVHNILPHKSRFFNDLTIRKVMAKLCDLKIVHANSVISELKALGIDTNNILVIPIGNYIGQVPNDTNFTQAREFLNISQSAFVYLLFGAIEDYKGADNLITTFINLNLDNTYLIIAGKCKNPTLKAKLEELAKTHSNILLKLEFIPDKMVQYYINASDIIVNPFKRITTSSSVVCAFSFKKTVIAPKMGALKDIPDDVGYFYLENGLKEAMVYAYKNKNKLPQLNIKAYDYIKNFSWNIIAKQTFEAFKNLK